MQKIRQTLFKQGLPSFLDAPDVVKSVQDSKQRLKKLVRNIVNNYPITKGSLPDA